MTDHEETTLARLLVSHAASMLDAIHVTDGDFQASLAAVLWRALELQVGNPALLALMINQSQVAPIQRGTCSG